MEKLLSEGAEVLDNPYQRRLTREELVTLLSQGIVGTIAGLEPFDRDVMSQSELKVISRCGSGRSNVDLASAEELGITVCYTPDAPVASVAEMTLGAMLGLLRRIPFMDSELHQGKWSKRLGNELEGKTVSIIGFGRIGRRLRELLEPFRVRLLVVDPYVRKEEGFEIVSLNEALKQSDIISLHASGEECLIGKKEFVLLCRKPIGARGS